MSSKKIIVTCKNLAVEIRTVLEQDALTDIELRVIPIRCCHPPSQRGEFDIPNIKGENQDVIFLGGVCFKNLKLQSDDSSRRYWFGFDHCFELFMNKGMIDYFIRKGVYLVTSGWMMNWEQHLSEWGFDQKTAGMFFQESCKSLLLLDTGVYPDSTNRAT